MKVAGSILVMFGLAALIFLGGLGIAVTLLILIK